jgi:hypothetical protein
VGDPGILGYVNDPDLVTESVKCILLHWRSAAKVSSEVERDLELHRRQCIKLLSTSSAHSSAAKLTNIENAISVTKDRVISESILESGETAKDGLSPLSREDFNLVTKSKKIQPKEVSDDNFKLLLKN